MGASWETNKISKANNIVVGLQTISWMGEACKEQAHAFTTAAVTSAQHTDVLVWV